MTPAAARDKAHKDRVTAIVWHKNFLYSVSYSGSLKMWDGNSLELVAHVSRAHEGGRIHCAAAGPDGYLYTGGDDKVCTLHFGGMGPASHQLSLMCVHHQHAPENAC